MKHLKPFGLYASTDEDGLRLFNAEWYFRMFLRRSSTQGPVDALQKHKL